GQQLLGALELLEPARRGREPHLLIRQFLQSLLIVAFHGMHSVGKPMPPKLTSPLSDPCFEFPQVPWQPAPLLFQSLDACGEFQVRRSPFYYDAGLEPFFLVFRFFPEVITLVPPGCRFPHGFLYEQRTCRRPMRLLYTHLDPIRISSHNS